MAKLRVFAKRPTPLEDQNIVTITNFNTEFDVDIMQQLDAQTPTLVQKVKFTPETTTTPPGPDQPPQPAGDLLYDSNVDIDWAAIQAGLKEGEEFLKIDDTFGDVKANGKGFHMNASGNPRMLLFPATKTLVVEHDGKYGRAYFAVCNYASRIEAEFKLDTPKSNASFKDRCRHQFRDMVNDKASDEETQGGQGSSFAEDKVDADLEIVHGGSPQEVSGPTKSLSPKLEVNKWYKIKFSQFDKDGKIHVIDELDRGDGQGFKVVNEGDVKAPQQFFNKAQFEEWSEFWVRLNADNGGKLYIKNLKMYKL